jgi:hypothetical protein
MTPAELDALDDDTLLAFVRLMEREAGEIKKSSRR